ncbi:MAG TPA: efflux RND transporter periplasmic adaptor subunit [Elusimicrobiota bacterium]|nr:efflux RND transporter periplasmic adaptor subunit [Elusimicrobiota bacterium]
MKTFIHVLMSVAFIGLAGCGGKTSGGSGEHADETGESSSHNAGAIEVSVESQKEGGIVTETLKITSVPETFQAMGRVMQDAQKPHHVTAGGPGRIETLAVSLGQVVNPGDVLAVIKSPSGVESKVTAPHKGIVTALHNGEGDSVNEMTFLCTLTDVDPLWGVLDIPERNLERVRPGQKVVIRTTAYPREVFRGKVAFISPEIDTVSRTVKARVAIENPAGLLKFGMFIDAAVLTGGHFQGVSVPADAVQNGPVGPFVFVKTGESSFVPRPVETGREKDGLVEILKGVAAGDSVAVEGSFLLKSEMMKEQMGEGH